ncbi:major capsid protein [Dyella soli]|nr:major capsid protein [Dyella soli]
MNVANKLKATVALLTAALAPLAANAAAPDTSAIVQVVTDAGTAAAAIGVAVLSMHFGIKLYKWIKAAG